MQDINSLILVGRLTRDIDVKYSQGGKARGKTGYSQSKDCYTAFCEKSG